MEFVYRYYLATWWSVVICDESSGARKQHYELRRGHIIKLNSTSVRQQTPYVLTKYSTAKAKLLV